ncbi:MAG TPA: helix-turn-helix domain-containing protein [Dehalococcoidia bacterium]|nr:helix-turn-helix domain-containing protein [Dehalococcoidia bacterium]
MANRARILEAARVVFALKGLDAEVREIAERAGVGVGTLYRHFDSREGLLTALIQQAKDDIIVRVRAATAGGDPAVALRTMVHAGAEACEQFGALTEAALAGRLQHLQEADTGFPEVVRGLLQMGVYDGTFRRDLDIPVTVGMLRAAFSSGAILEIAARRSYPEAADAVADFILRAITAPGP